MSAVEATEVRRQRGLAIASLFRITRKEGYWLVPSQKGQGHYHVRPESDDPSKPLCTCPDFAERGEPCKHVFAVRFAVERESHPDGSETVTETLQVTREALCPKRKTYKQDWPAYNEAQINEKARLQTLLRDLCQGIPEPPPSRKGGRPPVPMADRAFACAFKVYTTISGRRASTDIREAREKGHIDRAPHYSSVARYLEDPAMTPILRSLIVESARPLASVEVDFAADSSGFTTCRFETWYDHKYGVVRRQHSWVKVHVMTGVKTNVVTAVEIRDKLAQDSPILPDLLGTTAERFTMREVSCDKVYASLNNYAEISRHGATPFIPFKSIHTGAGGGLWAKMFHYYNFNREDFLAHYHKRSNVESTFSMVKAKFGDAVRSKTETAMVNEVLCKLLCHNLCCLIQSACELGIEATFWGDDKPAMSPDSTSNGEKSSTTGSEWDWI